MHLKVFDLWSHPFSAVNFSEFDKEPSGKVNLIGRIKFVSQSSYLLTSTNSKRLVLSDQEPSRRWRATLSRIVQTNLSPRPHR